MVKGHQQNKVLKVWSCTASLEQYVTSARNTGQYGNKVWIVCYALHPLLAIGNWFRDSMPQMPAPLCTYVNIHIRNR